MPSEIGAFGLVVGVEHDLDFFLSVAVIIQATFGQTVFVLPVFEDFSFRGPAGDRAMLFSIEVRDASKHCGGGDLGVEFDRFSGKRSGLTRSIGQAIVTDFDRHGDRGRGARFGSFFDLAGSGSGFLARITLEKARYQSDKDTGGGEGSRFFLHPLYWALEPQRVNPGPLLTDFLIWTPATSKSRAALIMAAGPGGTPAVESRTLRVATTAQPASTKPMRP